MSHRKKPAPLVVVIVWILGVIALATAGIAAATSDDYLYDLNHAGISGSKSTLLKLGYQACADASGKVSKSNSVSGIESATGLGSSDAEFLYDSALQFLCP